MKTKNKKSTPEGALIHRQDYGTTSGVKIKDEGGTN